MLVKFEKKLENSETRKLRTQSVAKIQHSSKYLNNGKLEWVISIFWPIFQEAN